MFGLVILDLNCATVGYAYWWLVLSQLLTLFTTPVIYLYLDRFQSWLSGKKPEHEEVPEGLGVAAE